MIHEAATTLGHALRAGLCARDLHPGNLTLHDGALTLVDLGSASIDTDADIVHTLAPWRYTLCASLSYTARQRALRTLLAAAGHDPNDAHRLTPAIEERAQDIAARHRRGRDRRARRNGKHFVQVNDGEVPGVVAGVRRRAWRGPSLADCGWLLHPIEGAIPLKADGSVVRVDRGGTSFVVKRYAPPTGTRTPRPMRAFRRAFALENRLIPAARPQVALVDAQGGGVLVTDLLPGRDVHAWVTSSDGPATWPATRVTAAVRTLGRMLRTMHDQRVRHRDLKAPNLMWEDDGALAGRFAIVDMDGVRIARHAIGWRRRTKDLARLAASVGASRTTCVRLLRAYRAPFPRPPIDLATMLAWLDRAVRKKRGPSGAPR